MGLLQFREHRQYLKAQVGLSVVLCFRDAVGTCWSSELRWVQSLQVGCSLVLCTGILCGV
jgi:hypothetical protein